MKGLLYCAVALGAIAWPPARMPLAHAQQPAPVTQATSRAARPPTTQPSGVPVDALTEAEQIIRLRKAVEKSKQEISETQKKLDAPDGEYHVAEARFGKLDARMTELKKQRQEQTEKNPPGDTKEVDDKIKELTPHWEDARTAFGLAVEERKTLTEKLNVLQNRLKQQSESLAALTEVKPATPVAGQNTPANAANPAAPSTSATATSAPKNTAVASTTPATTTSTASAKPPTPAPADTKAEQEKKEAVAKAQQKVEQKQNESAQADQQLQTLEDRKATLLQEMDTERKLMEMASKKQEQAREEQKHLRDSLAEHPEESAKIWPRIFDARQRESQAQRDAKESADRLADLEQELSQLDGQHAKAAAVANAKRDEVKAAQKQLETLQNPFTPHNILQWLIDHGPKLFMILLGMGFLQLLVKLFGRQIASLVAKSGDRGTLHDRQNRANTLVGVFRQTASLTIMAGGTVMLLDEVGVPIVPLLGGAAVLGLAVAFGAQNLIRDYFAGFMVLVEDQYAVGDVVRIGSIAGVVERISLRMTMLRDLEGTAHFIPHGSIVTVSNLTHSWSQLVVDVGIAYNQSVDRVMRVLMEIANDMRNEAQFKDMILDNPEMLGVDSLGESSVVVRLVMKTQPMKQWTIKRELQRRIKNRFDELGIEIPFRQLTIHTPESTAAAALEDMRPRRRRRRRGAGSRPHDGGTGSQRPTAPV